MKIINRVLYSEIGADKRGLFFLLVLMLSVVVLDAIAPWPFKVLIDNVLGGAPLALNVGFEPLRRLFASKYLLGFFAILVYFGSTFALSLVEYLQSVFTKSIIKNLTASFSKNAFKNLESLAIGFYKKQQIGDYIYRLSYDVSAIGELLEDGVLPFLTSALYLLVTLGVMVLISPKLTILSLVALPFLAVGLYSFNASITRATKRSESLSSATFSFIEEALTHLKIIQAFTQERRKSGEFNKRSELSLRSDVAMYKLDFLLTLLVGLIIAIGYSVIMLYGVQSVFAGTLTTGLLIVFIFYLDNLTNPILSIIYAVTAIRQSYLKISRMQDFFSKRTHLEYVSGGIKEIYNPTIKFDHVSFAGKGKKILKNVSFEIEAGKRTVIFGANGSGKTTIVNLLLRFVDKPTSGDIFIGGINLEDYNLKALRENIAFVPQEIALFNDTVKNNVIFGNPESTVKDIETAIRLAVAEDFIKKLPGKLEFGVGEGGNFLSGGQKQRIMLARAFLKKDAKILLFDETLSALDVKSRKEVLENIRNFSTGKTTIIVSNIFEVASAADNVVVLDGGRLVYAGPSSRLPRESSLYKIILKSEKENE